MPPTAILTTALKLVGVSTTRSLESRAQHTQTYIGGGRKNSTGANALDEEMLGERDSQNSEGRWSLDLDEEGRHGRIVATKSCRVDG